MKTLGKNQARIFEVGPRDGLQNESVILPIETKVSLIEQLADAGLRDIEIGSFVHPKWVPQMANTGEVAKTIKKKEGVSYWALVPNEKGLARAIDAGIEHIAIFMSSSETHNRKNINRSISESLNELEKVTEQAVSQNCEVRAYISTVFGCPYEGDVDFNRVIEIADALFSFGASQVSLGDTIGAGTPLQVKENCSRIVDPFGQADNFALHLHDTHGLALTNAFAAFLEGFRNFDSSVGGLGGCPYAPGAPGNLRTEDLLKLLNSMNIDTQVDRGQTDEIAKWLESSVGFDLSTRLSFQ